MRSINLQAIRENCSLIKKLVDHIICMRTAQRNRWKHKRGTRERVFYIKASLKLEKEVDRMIDNLITG